MPPSAQMPTTIRPCALQVCRYEESASVFQIYRGTDSSAQALTTEGRTPGSWTPVGCGIGASESVDARPQKGSSNLELYRVSGSATE